MSERPEEITKHNVFSVDIASIARDARFPSLTFENSRVLLTRVQGWLKEVNDAPNRKLLSNEDIKLLRSYVENLIKHLSDLLDFDRRTTAQDAESEHDNLERRAINFYNIVYKQVPMRILPFLRQEALDTKKYAEEVANQLREIGRAQKETEKLKEQLLTELSDVKARRSEVEKEQGEFIAVGLGKDFGDQAEQYQGEADKWLRQRGVWLRSLLYIIAGNTLLFFTLLIGNLVNENFTSPNQVFTVEYGVAKLTLLLLLSYAVGFCSRNYNINSGLAVTNRHRKNVAEVLLNALSSPLTDDAKGEIVRLATREMFVHLPVGYISKEHQNDPGPIVEVLKKVPTVSAK